MPGIFAAAAPCTSLWKRELSLPNRLIGESYASGSAFTAFETGSDSGSKLISDFGSGFRFLWRGKGAFGVFQIGEHHVHEVAHFLDRKQHDPLAGGVRPQHQLVAGSDLQVLFAGRRVSRSAPARPPSPRHKSIYPPDSACRLYRVMVCRPLPLVRFLHALRILFIHIMRFILL